MRLFLYILLATSLAFSPTSFVLANADSNARPFGIADDYERKVNSCRQPDGPSRAPGRAMGFFANARAQATVYTGSAQLNRPADAAGTAGITESSARQAAGGYAVAMEQIEDERRNCECEPKQSQLTEEPARTNENNQFQQDARDVREQCRGALAYYRQMADADKDRYFGLSGRSSLAKKALIAGGVAAAGLGAYMLLKGKKKKDDDKEEDDDKDAELAEKERAAGIITTADGKKVECFSQAHFQKVECEATMLRLCQTDEKKNTGGCNSFNNFRCSGMGEGADSMYCLHTAAETYCKQPGSLISSSPSCQWSASRPAECKEDPESIECRVPISAAELDAKCANYPNDPICKAKDTVAVTQPGGSASGGNGVSTIGANDGSNANGGGAANGNDNANGGNSGNQAGNGNGNGSIDLGDGAGSLNLDSITGNGGSARGTASASSSGGSNLVSNQSALLKSLCSSGQLVGCPN